MMVPTCEVSFFGKEDIYIYIYMNDRVGGGVRILGDKGMIK